jgi:hypothetical protein
MAVGGTRYDPAILPPIPSEQKAGFDDFEEIPYTCRESNPELPSM